MVVGRRLCCCHGCHDLRCRPQSKTMTWSNRCATTSAASSPPFSSGSTFKHPFAVRAPTRRHHLNAECRVMSAEWSEQKGFSPHPRFAVIFEIWRGRCRIDSVQGTNYTVGSDHAAPNRTCLSRLPALRFDGGSAPVAAGGKFAVSYGTHNPQPH
jgi:hypothetical protein